MEDCSTNLQDFAGNGAHTSSSWNLGSGATELIASLQIAKISGPGETDKGRVSSGVCRILGWLGMVQITMDLG